MTLFILWNHLGLLALVCVCVFFFFVLKLVSNTALPCLIVIACDPALRCAVARGGKRKGRLQLRFWNLNICMEKVDEKCWLADMTLIMTSLPLAPFFVTTFCWLAEIWQLIRRGATGELEVEFKFQRRNCKLSLIFPPCRQSAIESLLANYA